MIFVLWKNVMKIVLLACASMAVFSIELVALTARGLFHPDPKEIP
jgi:hypothetical protein